MFDLEHEIERWRRELLDAGLNACELDELEDHLRTDIEEQLRSGIGLRQGFETAAARIGPGSLLKTQFKQAHRRRKQRTAAILAKATLGVLLTWTVLFIGIACLAGFELALKSSTSVLGVVFLAISAGLIWTHRRKGGKGTSPDLSEFALGAQRCLELAKGEARELGHDYVGTEHVLLALASLDTGVLAALLDKARVSRAALREEVEQRICSCTAQGSTASLPYTPRLKKALGLALGEAASDHRQADAEHVLIGLLAERAGVAGCVLRSFGLSAGQVRSWLA